MRLDKYLTLNGLVSSRARAVFCIENGDVIVDGGVITKASFNVTENHTVVISGSDIPWVSRAGLKLAHAFEVWKISVIGKVCLDIGASTGGFTEVLLSHGAQKVYALDVGHNQLHEKLKEDARVINLEGTHIKDVDQSTFSEVIEFICIDVSFISLEHVLPKAYEILGKGCSLVALIKPQFEVGKDNIKKGIVSPELHEQVQEKVRTIAETCGFTNILIIDSPIEGGSGNKEFLMYAQKDI